MPTIPPTRPVTVGQLPQCSRAEPEHCVHLRSTWSLFMCLATRSMSERDTLIHAAVPAAGVFTTWRRRRAAAKQDAFVKAWKTAWTDGCRRRWEGGPRDEPSYAQDDQRAAWLAGWQWADAHPDRRQQSGPLVRGYRRSTDRHARFARGARRGIVGLTLVAVGRWWWRRRGLARPEPVSSPQHMGDSGP